MKEYALDTFHLPPLPTRKIRFGFYWRSIFRESYATIRKCVSCHQFSGKVKRYMIPLQPIIVEQPFSQWGLDVVRPINPKSRKVGTMVVNEVGKLVGAINFRYKLQLR
jgi:hypothetical protein